MATKSPATSSDNGQMQSDISSLKTDMALLKQSYDEVVKPSLIDIKETLKTMAFVPLKEFEEYKLEVNNKFREANRRRWVQNTLSGLAAALIASLVTYIVLGWINNK